MRTTIGLCLAVVMLSGCAESSFVMRPAINVACTRIPHIKGCAQLTDSVLAALEKDNATAKAKFREAVKINEPAQMVAFVNAIDIVVPSLNIKTWLDEKTMVAAVASYPAAIPSPITTYGLIEGNDPYKQDAPNIRGNTITAEADDKNMVSIFTCSKYQNGCIEWTPFYLDIMICDAKHKCRVEYVKNSIGF